MMTHTPGPWSACKNGECPCGQIWSTTADHPVAEVISGTWGDTYPALRPRDEGMSGTVVEAYLERIDYGSVDPEQAKANAVLISSAPDLLHAVELVIKNAPLISEWIKENDAGAFRQLTEAYALATGEEI